MHGGSYGDAVARTLLADDVVVAPYPPDQVTIDQITDSESGGRECKIGRRERRRGERCAAGAQTGSAPARVYVPGAGSVGDIVVGQVGDPDLLGDTALFHDLAVGAVVTAARALRIVHPEAADRVGQVARILRCPEADGSRRNEPAACAADRIDAVRVGQEQLDVGRRSGQPDLVLLEVPHPTRTALSIRTEHPEEHLVLVR